MKRFLAILLVLIIFPKMSTYAEVTEYDEIPYLQKMHATAYVGPSDYTYSGKHVREGLAAANKKHLGQTAIVYQRLPGNKVGEVIGIYEIEDTGNTKGIIDDNVIDIWCNDLDNCQLLMDRVYENGCQGKVFVQFLEAEG